MEKLSIDDLDLKDKRVLVRVDFNVPLNEKGEVADDTKIVESLPTINKIIGDGGKAILMSHFGRPKGKVVPEMSLTLVYQRLVELLDTPVIFIEDCVGLEVEEIISEMQPGQCLLLENLRFYPEEEENDPIFARDLSRLGDLYVNDAFGCAHRAHASIEVITTYFDQCAAGYLMLKELKYLGMALDNPQRPFVPIIGGSKISGKEDKIDIIQNLLDKADNILIGGAIPFTCLKAKDIEVGKSLYEPEKIKVAEQILEKGSYKLILPSDFVVAPEATKEAPIKVVGIHEIPPDWLGVDIGSETSENFANIIKKARTVIKIGPMGVIEIPRFATGDIRIFEELAKITKEGATTVAGGGNTKHGFELAKKESNLPIEITHFCTAGGAFAYYAAGKTLPGVAALTDK